jgi:hypothetical protein
MPPRCYAGRTVWPRQAHGGSVLAETRLCFCKWRPAQSWLGEEIGQLAPPRAVSAFPPPCTASRGTCTERQAQQAGQMSAQPRCGRAMGSRVVPKPSHCPGAEPSRPCATLSLPRSGLYWWRSAPAEAPPATTAGAAAAPARASESQVRPLDRQLLLSLLPGVNQKYMAVQIASRHRHPQPQAPSLLSRLRLLPCRRPAGPPTASMEATWQRCRPSWQRPLPCAT